MSDERHNPAIPEVGKFRLYFRINGREFYAETNIAADLAAHFSPLPREHDLPGLTGAPARCKAEQQRRHRAAVARMVAKNLCATILDTIEQRDPRFGYTPEENRAFFNPPTTD